MQAIQAYSKEAKKLRKATLVRKHTEDIIMASTMQVKNNKKLRGESLFMNLLTHDAGHQINQLQDYLNSFKPMKTSP